MKAIKRSTLGEKILNFLVNMIKSDGYRAGDKLPTEKEISERFGVGRNSVREAMKTLCMAGVTESTPGKGTYLLVNPDDINLSFSGFINEVQGFSPAELLEARKLIETEAAVLAAERVNRDSVEWAIFKSSLEQLAESLDAKNPDASKSDFNFHLNLVKMSGNYFLYKMVHSIVKDIERSKKIIAIDFENAEFEKKIHIKIFTAVESGDKSAVRAAMDEHFANTMSYCK